MVDRSSEMRVLEFFSAADHCRVGRFAVDPGTGAWWWDDTVFGIFGYPVGAVQPGWDLIVAHAPGEERAMIEAAFTTASRQPGPFSWSQRVSTAQGETRSVLIVGDSAAGGGGETGRDASVGQAGIVPGDTGTLAMSGYVLDLTTFRVEAARSAGSDAVHRSTAHRAVIEQAKGALMLAYHLDADAAFALLAWHSQQTNRKLHAIAASVVATVSNDGLPTSELRTTLDRIMAQPVHDN